jgi:hypothetical protein
LADEKTKTADGTFEFGGYHFTPYRQFGNREIQKRLEGDSRPWKNDAAYAMRNMSSSDIGISKYSGNSGYSHEKFYAAAGGSNSDIFRCAENGKLYVPAENELLRYTEPKQRTQKKSVINALDNAKKEVAKAAGITAEKKPPTRKQTELE